MSVKHFYLLYVYLCFNYCASGQETAAAATDSKNEDNLLPSVTDNAISQVDSSTASSDDFSSIVYKGKVLVCPSNDIRKPWFPLPCKVHKNCNIFDPTYLCCDSKCLKGVPPPSPEPIHSRLFGIIEQECPVEPLPEIFSIKPCKSDKDCAPRICCRENGSINHYCRTPVPKLDRIPYADDLLRPVKLFFSYMQCTPRPPLVLDIFSKPCQSSLDCFPNLCCQEDGKKFCRPPKRSILTLVAGITQRIGSQEIAKRLIERIS